MAGDSIWDLYFQRMILVQTACSFFKFSKYHNTMLHCFSAFAPLFLAMGSAVSPDMLDVAFLIAVNTAIWWTNFFNSLIEWLDRTESLVEVFIWGCEFVIFAVIGYISAFILTSSLFIPATLCVFLLKTSFQTGRVVLMAGSCIGMGGAFSICDTNQDLRGGSRRLGLSVGATFFFVREHGFFSSNIYYTWERIGEVLSGEVTEYDHKFFLLKKPT